MFLGYDKLLVGPDDVGGICPASTYMWRGQCCCGASCCWDQCDWSTPPATCIQEVPDSRWIFNTNLVYYQAFKSTAGFNNSTPIKTVFPQSEEPFRFNTKGEI